MATVGLIEPVTFTADGTTDTFISHSSCSYLKNLCMLIMPLKCIVIRAAAIFVIDAIIRSTVATISQLFFNVNAFETMFENSEKFHQTDKRVYGTEKVKDPCSIMIDVLARHMDNQVNASFPRILCS